ncbi:hypothetical protein [Luteolibacter soli]|uniref:hypothetical protein n=1 Tax=Luteolibacter soli TaxID=3135280 RepID=UPI003119B4D0
MNGSSDAEVARIVRVANNEGTFLHQAVIRLLLQEMTGPRRRPGHHLYVDDVIEEYPLVFGQQLRADIIARCSLEGPMIGGVEITLAIECKRAYLGTRKLIFLPAIQRQNRQQVRIFRRTYVGKNSPYSSAVLNSCWASINDTGHSLTILPVSDAGMWVEVSDQRERGGTALNDAAIQACRATLGLIAEEKRKVAEKSFGYLERYYLPVIVTNAPLFMLDGTEGVDLATGNLHHGGVSLRTVPAVLLRHPFSRMDEGDGDPRQVGGNLDCFGENEQDPQNEIFRYKETILVITASHLPSLLHDDDILSKIATSILSCDRTTPARQAS